MSHLHLIPVWLSEILPWSQVTVQIFILEICKLRGKYAKMAPNDWSAVVALLQDNLDLGLWQVHKFQDWSNSEQEVGLICGIVVAVLFHHIPDTHILPAPPQVSSCRLYPLWDVGKRVSAVAAKGISVLLGPAVACSSSEWGVGYLMAWDRCYGGFQGVQDEGGVA